MNIMIWIFVALFLVVLMMVFKAKEVRHKMGFLVVACICLFLAFSFFQVYKTHKVDLKSFEGVVTAGKLYFSWLGHVFTNVKDTVGYAIKQDWSVNSTQIPPAK